MITTFVVPGRLEQPFTVSTTSYVPVWRMFDGLREGFWRVEVKLAGPVHAHDPPATFGVVRFRASPSQTGLLLEAVGVAGVAITVTVVEPEAAGQDPVAAISLFTVYKPAADAERSITPVFESITRPEDDEKTPALAVGPNIGEGSASL